MLKILHSLKQWHPYLIGRHLKVKTSHDSIKYFLEQRLSSEEQQKQVENMFGYDFEIMYKRGSKVLSQMHSPGKMRMLKHYSMLFRSSNQIGQLKQWINGKMTKKYGHLIKSCSRIPVPLIHLGGKMTCYGTRIAYILVRVPSSTKRYFLDITPHRQESTQVS